MSPLTASQSMRVGRAALSPPGGPGFDMSLRRTAGPGEPMAAEDRLRPGQVRRVGRAHADRWGFSACGDAVGLCLSELVTNALAHAEGDVGVRMWCTDTQICIEVSSGARHVPPCPREAGLLDESGRGLSLVAAYADSWGVDQDGSRTHVWCALGRSSQ
ncbi:ATP-binding protein [Streptomyces sp. NPDC055078]